MSAEARVSRPAEGADRFRPARALAAASIGLAAGLFATWLARSDERAAPSTTAMPAPEPPAATLDAESAAQDALAAEATTAVADAAVADAAVAHAAPLAQAAAWKRSVTLGTVAYLRCDGVELRSGRFPCPRDQALEAAGWRALEALASCRDADPGAGALEVRLDLAGHEVVDARYLCGEETGLDAAAIERCVDGTLRELRTELQPDRMIVSFRLELR